MSQNNDDEIAQEGIYYCWVCEQNTKFTYACWQQRTMWLALNFEQSPSQTILCCEICKTPLNRI